MKFAIIGVGRFGSHLARELSASGAEVVALDRDGGLIAALRDDVTFAACLDSTDTSALAAQGVRDVDAAVVGIGEDFESAVLTVAALKELKVPRIVARAMTDIQGKILREVGAHSVVNAERETALRWAHRLTLPRLESYIELGEGYALVRMPAPQSFHHKTPVEIGLRQNYGVNLLAINRPQPVKDKDKKDDDDAVRETTFVPKPDTKILPEDILVLAGGNEDLSNLASE